jgi:hypothetical protein
MVYSIGVKNQNISGYGYASFGKEDKAEKPVNEDKDTLLYDKKKNHPILTGMEIQRDKFVNAFTKYPQKGFAGSKNANFYEFLTMGMVPYLMGSATMIGVFNLAAKFFDTPAAVNASKLGKKMGLGVVMYGLGKTLSKKLVETPVNAKYGIDVNLPYKKVIHELPDGDNTDNLVAYEYHKAYESVDFPRWDLFYDNKSFGTDRNSYYEKVGKKMGLKDDDLEHADQKVKPLIKEKVIKTKLFSTLSSYLWAATGVGIAMQKPWENLVINPVKRMNNHSNYKQLAQQAQEMGREIPKYKNFAKDFSQRFVSSCKEFLNNGNPATKIAGRALLGSAIAMTLLGNFSTLFDFNKNKGTKTHASTSLIDDTKEKVVC